MSDFIQPALLEEQLAKEKLYKACVLIVEAAPILFVWGDGHGGHIIKCVVQALEDAGFSQPNHTPAKRKKIASATRKRIFERDAYRCVACGDFHNLVVDHIIPLNRGGSDEMDNFQTLCHTCNSVKSDRIY
jgi:HNH endonuclease